MHADAFIPLTLNRTSKEYSLVQGKPCRTRSTFTSERVGAARTLVAASNINRDISFFNIFVFLYGPASSSICAREANSVNRYRIHAELHEEPAPISMTAAATTNPDSYF